MSFEMEDKEELLRILLLHFRISLRPIRRSRSVHANANRVYTFIYFTGIATFNALSRNHSELCVPLDPFPIKQVKWLRIASSKCETLGVN